MQTTFEFSYLKKNSLRFWVRQMCVRLLEVMFQTTIPLGYLVVVVADEADDGALWRCAMAAAYPPLQHPHLQDHETVNRNHHRRSAHDDQYSPETRNIPQCAISEIVF